jgi:hypothetical protein
VPNALDVAFRQPPQEKAPIIRALQHTMSPTLSREVAKKTKTEEKRKTITTIKTMASASIGFKS